MILLFYLLLVFGPSIGLILATIVNAWLGFALLGSWLLLVIFVFAGFWL
jgi:hypothetical protein